MMLHGGQLWHLFESAMTVAKCGYGVVAAKELLISIFRSSIVLITAFLKRATHHVLTKDIPHERHFR